MLHNGYISTKPDRYIIHVCKIHINFKSKYEISNKQNKTNPPHKTHMSLLLRRWFLSMPIYIFMLLCHYAVLAEKLEKPWFGHFLEGSRISCFDWQGIPFKQLLDLWVEASFIHSVPIVCQGWKWHTEPALREGTEETVSAVLATGPLQQPAGSFEQPVEA